MKLSVIASLVAGLWLCHGLAGSTVHPQSGAAPAAQETGTPSTPAECFVALKGLSDQIGKANSYTERVPLQAKLNALAANCAARFTVDRFESRHLAALGQLYAEAGQFAPARDAVMRRLSEQGLSVSERADALLTAIEVLASLRDEQGKLSGKREAEEAMRQLDALGDAAWQQQIKGYRRINNFYRSATSDPGGKGEKGALRFISMYDKVPPDQRGDLRFGLYIACENLATIYGYRGDDERARQVLHEGIKKFTADPQAGRERKITEFLLGRYELPGRPAPAIEAEYWINGEPPGKKLELAGQVTLIEFTAHWCIPCRDSYPAILQLHEKFNSRGLRVLFATQLYGYFGSNRNWTVEQELAADRKYYAEEHKLPFPIAVSAAPSKDRDGHDQNSRNYYSQAIPQFVVVDRQGIVRRILVGWDSDIEQLITRIVEELVSRGK